MQSGILRAHAIRIHPGEDLVPALQSSARLAMSLSSSSQSCLVLTAVGSVSEVTLRMAHADREQAVVGQQEDDSTSSSSHQLRTWKERLEIVSLVGTLSRESKHLHMCLSDAEGRTVGGHLVDGKIFTTLELVLGTIEGVAFDRTHDERTGYSELVVEAVPSNQQDNSQRTV
jgi:uncharacterized protein